MQRLVADYVGQFMGSFPAPWSKREMDHERQVLLLWEVPMFVVQKIDETQMNKDYMAAVTAENTNVLLTNPGAIMRLPDQGEWVSAMSLTPKKQAFAAHIKDTYEFRCRLVAEVVRIMFDNNPRGFDSLLMPTSKSEHSVFALLHQLQSNVAGAFMRIISGAEWPRMCYLHALNYSSLLEDEKQEVYRRAGLIDVAFDPDTRAPRPSPTLPRAMADRLGVVRYTYPIKASSATSLLLDTRVVVLRESGSDIAYNMVNARATYYVDFLLRQQWCNHMNAIFRRTGLPISYPSVNVVPFYGYHVLIGKADRQLELLRTEADAVAKIVEFENDAFRARLNPPLVFGSRVPPQVAYFSPIVQDDPADPARIAFNRAETM